MNWRVRWRNIGPGALPTDMTFLWRHRSICVHVMLRADNYTYTNGATASHAHYWRWRGRAAGQGMIFTVIHIGTGYLNRPNWLLVGYSVYHRVASRLPSRVPSPQCLWQARNLGTSDGACWTTMFMTGPRSPRSGTSDGACGTQQIFMNVSWYIHSRIESPSLLIQGMHMKVLVRYIGTGHMVYFLQNRESVRTNTGYAYESFSKVYWDRVYFLRAEWIVTGSGFRPPAAPPPPPGILDKKK